MLFFKSIFIYHPRDPFNCIFRYITGFTDSTLEGTLGEPWSWDTNTKSRAQGISTLLTSFKELVAFSVLFNGLEHLKPLVTNFQQRNSDIFQDFPSLSND